MIKLAKRLKQRVVVAAIDAAQPSRISLLASREQEERFEAVAPRYGELVTTMDIPASRQQDGAYPWDDWAKEIRSAFAGGLPANFLRHPRIAGTMVFSGFAAMKERLATVSTAFGEAATPLLKEDAIGRPRILDSRLLTSANRAHHTYHLASYQLQTGVSVFDGGSFLEWGGGYGSMARLVRKRSPRVTYVIVDLAPILAMQYVYLSALESEDALHVLTERSPTVAAGKINLVPASLALSGALQFRPNLFLSTWAATESPSDVQDAIATADFFGARHILLAYAKDASNRLAAPALARGCSLLPISILARERMLNHHEYAFA